MSPPVPQPQAIAAFRSLIWHALDNELLSTALFTAERLHAYDPKSADSVHLFALCLYRDGQYRAAETLTAGWLPHVGCAYIYAQCCLKQGGGRESQGIAALEGCKRLWDEPTPWGQHTDTERRALPDAAAISTLTGKLWFSLGENKKAVEPFVKAVKINPFLWEAFTGLCDTGANLRVQNVFKQTKEMAESLKLPANPAKPAAEDPSARRRNTVENMKDDPFMSSVPPRDRSELNYSNNPSFLNRLNEGVAGAANVPEMETPTAQSSNSSGNDVMAGNAAAKPPPLLRKTRGTAVQTRKLTSRVTRDNGVEGKRTVSSGADSTLPQRRSTRLNTFRGKLSGSDRESRTTATDRDKDVRTRVRQVSARSRTVASSTVVTAVSQREKVDKSAAGEDVNVRANLSYPSNPNPQQSSSTSQTPHARATRSTTAQAAVANKSKRRASVELTKVAKKQMSDAPMRPPPPPVAPKPQIDYKKEEAQLYMLELYKLLGGGYFALTRYLGAEALKALGALPQNQRETPWVLAQMGKVHYEMANYTEAEKHFLEVRRLDPGRTKDMEVFSTVLWHEHKDVELSYLAHELMDLDRVSPVAWCALGNCHSLGRDHDQALKCFKRATALDPKFAYAFTLQGHEHVSNEDYEKALAAYRCAITADQRHYNGWYGLGKVYEKMGKYEIAEKHFRSASKINPTNAVLVCCIGMVLEKMKDLRGALAQYQRACEMQPTSALSKFKKARTLMAMQDYPAAHRALMDLKDLAPDEANVHFLLGRLYSNTGDRANAIKHLTIANNLDPKAGHLIKEVMENLGGDRDSEEADDYHDEDPDVPDVFDVEGGA